MVAKDVAMSLEISCGDNEMCCPIPKRVEKLEKISSGIFVNGSLCNEYAKSELLLLLLEDGPSHKASVNGMLTLAPLAKDAVQITVSERINRTSFLLATTLEGRNEEDRDSPRDGLVRDRVIILPSERRDGGDDKPLPSELDRFNIPRDGESSCRCGLL